MTHMKPVDSGEGDFREPHSTLIPCRHCGRSSVTYRVWESHDGAYEDYEYICSECGHSWWVDGIDA